MNNVTDIRTMPDVAVNLGEAAEAALVDIATAIREGGGGEEVPANQRIYFVQGTQTESVNLWTGVIDAPALVDGMTIAYYLPYDAVSAAVQLQLTLNTGMLSSAKSVRYKADANIGTRFPAKSVIMLTYSEANNCYISNPLPADYDLRLNGASMANADLNLLTTIGRYYGSTAANSNTLTNTPKDGQWTAATLLLIYNIANNNVVQILTDGIDMYFRASYGAASAELRSWRPWRKITVTNA